MMAGWIPAFHMSLSPLISNETSQTPQQSMLNIIMLRTQSLARDCGLRSSRYRLGRNEIIKSYYWFKSLFSALAAASELMATTFGLSVSFPNIRPDSKWPVSCPASCACGCSGRGAKSWYTKSVSVSHSILMGLFTIGSWSNHEQGACQWTV